MLHHPSDSAATSRPDIAELIERLTQDSRRWAEAELAMARIEIDELKGHAVRAIVFGVVGIAATFCALVVLSQAGIAFITPYVDGPVVAALIVFALLLLLVGISFFLIRSAFTWRAESVFFRWFARGPRAGQS